MSIEDFEENLIPEDNADSSLDTTCNKLCDLAKQRKREIKPGITQLQESLEEYSEPFFDFIQDYDLNTEIRVTNSGMLVFDKDYVKKQLTFFQNAGESIATSLFYFYDGIAESAPNLRVASNGISLFNAQFLGYEQVLQLMKEIQVRPGKVAVRDDLPTLLDYASRNNSFIEELYALDPRFNEYAVKTNRSPSEIFQCVHRTRKFYDENIYQLFYTMTPLWYSSQSFTPTVEMEEEMPEYIRATGIPLSENDFIEGVYSDEEERRENYYPVENLLLKIGEEVAGRERKQLNEKEYKLLTDILISLTHDITREDNALNGKASYIAFMGSILCSSLAEKEEILNRQFKDIPLIDPTKNIVRILENVMVQSIRAMCDVADNRFFNANRLFGNLQHLMGNELFDDLFIRGIKAREQAGYLDRTEIIFSLFGSIMQKDKSRIIKAADLVEALQDENGSDCISLVEEEEATQLIALSARRIAELKNNGSHKTVRNAAEFAKDGDQVPKQLKCMEVECDFLEGRVFIKFGFKRPHDSFLIGEYDIGGEEDEVVFKIMPNQEIPEDSRKYLLELVAKTLDEERTKFEIEEKKKEQIEAKNNKRKKNGNNHNSPDSVIKPESDQPKIRVVYETTFSEELDAALKNPSSYYSRMKITRSHIDELAGEIAAGSKNEDSKGIGSCSKKNTKGVPIYRAKKGKLRVLLYKSPLDNSYEIVDAFYRKNNDEYTSRVLSATDSLRDRYEEEVRARNS